ncbi:hypothetical protein ACFW1L_04095, partial [Streptomyces olivaceus]
MSPAGVPRGSSALRGDRTAAGGGRRTSARRPAGPSAPGSTPLPALAPGSRTTRRLPMSAEPSQPTPSTAPRFGVWFIGARGSVATTAVAGCAAVAAGLHPPTAKDTQTQPNAP